MAVPYPFAILDLQLMRAFSKSVTDSSVCMFQFLKEIWIIVIIITHKQSKRVEMYLFQLSFRSGTLVKRSNEGPL